MKKNWNLRNFYSEWEKMKFIKGSHTWYSVPTVGPPCSKCGALRVKLILLLLKFNFLKFTF